MASRNFQSYTKKYNVKAKDVSEKFLIGEHVYDYFLGNNEPYKSNWIKGKLTKLYSKGAGGTWAKIEVDEDCNYSSNEYGCPANNLHHFPEELSEKDRLKFGYYEVE